MSRGREDMELGDVVLIVLWAAFCFTVTSVSCAALVCCLCVLWRQALCYPAVCLSHKNLLVSMTAPAYLTGNWHSSDPCMDWFGFGQIKLKVVITMKWIKMKPVVTDGGKVLQCCANNFTNLPLLLLVGWSSVGERLSAGDKEQCRGRYSGAS